MSSRLFLPFLVLLIVVGSATAQDLRSTDPNLRQTLRALRDSQMVRSVTISSARSQGRILQHNDTLLVLASEGGPVRVPSSAIDSLWVRGNSSSKGLLWGAVLGGVGGLALGLVIDQSLCETGCDGAIPVGGLAGVAVGAPLGALIGAAIPRWNRRWP